MQKRYQKYTCVSTSLLPEIATPECEIIGLRFAMRDPLLRYVDAAMAGGDERELCFPCATLEVARVLDELQNKYTRTEKVTACNSGE